MHIEIGNSDSPTALSGENTNIGVTIENLSASWSMDVDKLVLNDISITVDQVCILAYRSI